MGESSHSSLQIFFGNMHAAQAHVDGLVALLTDSETIDLEAEEEAGKRDEENQLVNRMLMYRMALVYDLTSFPSHVPLFLSFFLLFLPCDTI